jgi:glycosyltransferase involved in cell wall biosynthesis
MTPPEISVLIASHNRRETLRRCLNSLSEQHLDPTAFEVIVADDGSGDGTAEMVEDFDAPYALRVLRRPKQGKAPALNAAIDAAAPICLCIDDDIVAWPTLVSGHLKAHRDDPMTVGLGCIVQQPPDRRDWYARAFAAAWNDHYERLAKKPEPSWTDCYGANVSASRELLLKAGGFAVELPIGEDYEIGFRLREAGGVLTYLPDAGGVHDDQKPGKRLVADTRRQGISYVELVDRHPKMMPVLFGWFSEPTRREVKLRRLLLALRVPPASLRPLGRLLPDRGRRQTWMYFISRYGFWSGVRSSVDRERWVQISRDTPVLMYHGFDVGGERNRYLVQRRDFRLQMLALRLLRYRAITCGELVQTLREHRYPPPRSVVITIDDGYADNLEVAAPILARHGLRATLFLVSRRLGDANDWDSEPPIGGRPLMSAEQAMEMGGHGHELGAHTRTHCSLPDAGDDEMLEQVGGSRRDLEAALGVAVTTFAYPYGRHDERAVEAVASAGFAGACTTHPALVRLDEDPLRIPRIEVRGSDSLRTFLRKLRRGSG